MGRGGVVPSTLSRREARRGGPNPLTQTLTQTLTLTLTQTLTQAPGVVALFSGVIAVARSPASALAVIRETRAGGPFTQTVLGVTMVSDVLVANLAPCRHVVVAPTSTPRGCLRRR